MQSMMIMQAITTNTTGYPGWVGLHCNLFTGWNNTEIDYRNSVFKFEIKRFTMFVIAVFRWKLLFQALKQGESIIVMPLQNILYNTADIP